MSYRVVGVGLGNTAEPSGQSSAPSVPSVDKEPSEIDDGLFAVMVVMGVYIAWNFGMYVYEQEKRRRLSCESTGRITTSRRS